MSHKVFLIFIALIFANIAYSANNNTMVFGKVIEKESKNALGFATVTIKSPDNKIIGGTTTSNDGSFKLNSLSLGEYDVKVSFIGFRDTTLNLNIKSSEASHDLGIIELASDAFNLKSAIISAKVPMIEQKLDKIVMNVSETVSTAGSNALDVLKRAPGISVDPSGNILLNGISAQVWIDGRPSNLSGSDLESLLSGTDGSTIDKIEIMAHPSSKYDAAGSGGIINIKTKKNFAKGLNGSLRGSYTGAHYEKYYHSVDGTILLNYRNDKTSSTFTYSPRINNDFNTFDTKTGFGNDNRLLVSSSLFDRSRKNHGFRLSTDLFSNKKNIFGFIVSGTLRDFSDTTSGNTGSILYTNGIISERTITALSNKSNFDNLSANINYTHIFKENYELTLNSDYYNYNLGDYSYQKNNFTDNEGNVSRDGIVFRSNSQKYINILSFKSDYEQPFWKTGKMESGIKWAQSMTDNTMLRENLNHSLWTPDNNLSSKFKYNEQISAAYISFSKQFGNKWSLKGGLRAELTVAKGDWISSDTITSKKYLDFFPTFFAGFNPNENIKLSFSYTLRTQRPNFEQLNPHRFYIDATSSVVGNPDINPQYSHSVSLTLGIKKHLSISANGEFICNAIVQNPTIDSNNGEKFLIWDNFGSQTFLGGTISLTELPVASWFILNGNVFVAKMSTSNPGFSKSSLFSQANINCTFLLPSNFKAELSGSFQSGMPYGYFDIKPRGDVSVGIKKGMLGNKATLSLLASDIFQTNTSRASLKENVFNYEFESIFRSRRITLTFNYRFGQGKSIKARKVGSSEEAGRVSSGN